MCVLPATGAEFDPDAFLSASALEPCRVFRRGESRLPKSQPDGPLNAISGINFDVSGAPWSNLAAQLADAERFLAANHDEIVRLSQAPGVTDLVLDFPIELRIDAEDVAAQSDRFPASIVRLAGALGIALELSTYPRREG